MSESCSSKNLALLVEENAITYLTQSIQDSEYFFSEPVRFELKKGLTSISVDELLAEIKKQLPLLLYYNTIKVIYSSVENYIIPNAYLSNQEENNLSDIYQHKNFKINRLNDIDAKIIFKPFDKLNSVLSTLPNFNSAKYFHIGELLINNKDVNKDLTQVFVRLINQNLELCIFKNGEFNLYNSYKTNSEEDVLYYIMNAIQQLEINPAAVEVIIDYGITESHKAYEYLPKFVKNVKFNAPSDSSDFKFLLYNLFECE